MSCARSCVGGVLIFMMAYHAICFVLLEVYVFNYLMNSRMMSCPGSL